MAKVLPKITLNKNNSIIIVGKVPNMLTVGPNSLYI
jgi:hypothetical protein